MAKSYDSISVSEPGEIMCPFLKIIKPRTDNMWIFLRDCRRAGVAWFFAFIFGFFIVGKQKGWGKAFMGHAPDIYALDQVPEVSHDDLFQNYMDGVKSRIAEAEDENGIITMQDLVNIKKWIAQQSNVAIIDSSKVETGLVFLGSGGEAKTGKVRGSDVIKFLQGQRPTQGIGGSERRVVCLFPKFIQVGKIAQW